MPALRIDRDSNPSDETHDGLESEHIYIGGEFPDPSAEPTTITKYECIRNHVRGTVTELTFYDEGFLKIREGTKNKIEKEHVLELQFVNSQPVKTQRIATKCLWSSLGAAILALFVYFVLPLSSFVQYTISLTTILATLSTLGLLFFIYRSEVTHQFCTSSGQTAVLSLTGSFGCIRRMRAMVQEVQLAIERAGADAGPCDAQYLRAEMAAHYKLAETGVISREACSVGTALILSRFG